MAAGRPFAAYIDLDRRPGEKSARSAVIGPEIVADFAVDGRPIGIEIVSPEVVSTQEILSAFERLGLAPPDPAHLAPLTKAARS